jgi:ribosomal protein S18 acetylase RimI-like enzyme
MSPSQAIRIRRAGSEDAAALAELGRRTFEATFGAGNTPEDMAAYLGDAFGEDMQRAEILDPDTVTLLLEHAGALAGYAQLRRLGLPDEVDRREWFPSPIQLRRLYVDADFQGRGLGRRLLDEVHAAARALGGRTLWLTVWERNPRAVGFYEAAGWAVIGETVFVVGDDPQRDHVMAISVIPG